MSNIAGVIARHKVPKQSVNLSGEDGLLRLARNDRGSLYTFGLGSGLFKKKEAMKSTAPVATMAIESV